MNIIISNANGQPIYSQIYEQIKRAILGGEIAAGEALPSIRALAKDLRVSVITTKRAYEELERDGYIYTMAGKGCFVAEKNNELMREEHLRQMEAYLSKAVELARLCRVPESEVLEALCLLMKEP